MNAIWLDADTIRKNLSMADCIDAMEDLYKNEGSSKLLTPMRTVLKIDSDSVILTMPSYSPRLKRFAVKIVTEYKENLVKHSLPVQGGVTVLMDSEDSRTLATLDSPTITAIRTGAISGLATRFLARSDSEVVSCVGSGQQARAMLEAVCAVRGVKRATVWSRNPENSRGFADEMSERLDIDVVATLRREEATKKADIINVATNSSTPVLNWSEIRRGTHINSVGTLPDRRELDLETVCSSALFVDSREGVLNEAGDVIFAIRSGRLSEKAIQGDLSALVADSTEGREDNGQVTLFKSVGFALQDVYASSFVYSKISQANR